MASTDPSSAGSLTMLCWMNRTFRRPARGERASARGGQMGGGAGGHDPGPARPPPPRPPMHGPHPLQGPPRSSLFLCLQVGLDDRFDLLLVLQERRVDPAREIFAPALGRLRVASP